MSKKLNLEVCIYATAPNGESTDAFNGDHVDVETSADQNLIHFSNKKSFDLKLKDLTSKFFDKYITADDFLQNNVYVERLINSKFLKSDPGMHEMVKEALEVFESNFSPDQLKWKAAAYLKDENGETLTLEQFKFLLK